jgi:hypothetical protein
MSLMVRGPMVGSAGSAVVAAEANVRASFLGPRAHADQHHRDVQNGTPTLPIATLAVITHSGVAAGPSNHEQSSNRDAKEP